MALPERAAPAAQDPAPAAHRRPAQAERPATPGLEPLVAEVRTQAAAAADLPALLALAQTRGLPAGVLATPVTAPLAAWVVACADADDVAAGRLLAGPRGRLFARMTAAAGLDGRVLVAAAAPPERAAGEGRDVAGAAVHAVLLERVLQLAGPRVVVAAGAEALRALTGEEASILKAHGRLRDWTGPHFGLALPVMPTFSLETLLAQPPAKARAWRDILTLAARVDSETQGP